MLKQLRAVDVEQDTASTPELWAAAFAASTMTTNHGIRKMQRTTEWSLVRRYIRPGSHVADAGCGFGEWARVLESEGYRCTGIDYSAELIVRLHDSYPSGSWIHADIRSVPVPDETFDALISWGVIEHDEAGPADALREFYRMVRSGGIVIVSVPIDSLEQRRAARFLFPTAEKTAFFQYAMTSDELNKSLQETGFDLVTAGSIPGAAFAMMAPRLCMWARNHAEFGRFIERVGNAVARPFRRYHLMIYAVGRKRESV